MAKATKTKHPTDEILKELRAFGLAYPGAHFKSPWPGHMDLAVNDKTFAYLSIEGEPLGISCKLPRSSEVALMLPFCKPTGYGLGKSGWVSASFDDPDVDIDVAMLKAWIDESYRAQAPKKLIASLGAPVTGESAPAEEDGTGGQSSQSSKSGSKSSQSSKSGGKSSKSGGAKPATRAASAATADAKKAGARATSLRPAKRATAKAR